MKSIRKGLLAELLVMAAAAAVSSLCALWLEGDILYAAYWILQLIAVPAAACLTAAYAGRQGLAGILAWPLCPAVYIALYWLITGIPPLRSSCVLTVALSLIGAAAGEVLYKRKKTGE